MPHRSNQDLDQLVQLVRQAAERLPPQAIQQLIGHPGVVHSALAAAASTLDIAQKTALTDRTETLGCDTPSPQLSRQAATQRLAAHTRPGHPDDLLSADQFADRTGVKTRQSVHDWRRKGRILGWSGTKRGLVFPAAQLDERGRPPPDLDRILPFFPDHYSAWRWLNTPLPALDGQTPLARLRAGEGDRVVAAAAGDVQGDFA